MKAALIALFLLGATLPAAAQCASGTCNWKFAGQVNQPQPAITLGTPALKGLQGGLVSYGTTSLGFALMTSTFTKCTIKYGTTTSYGSSASETDYHTTDHSLTITGLTADTDYNYRFVCTDGFGNSVNTGNWIVTTKGPTTLRSVFQAIGGHIGAEIPSTNVPSQYVPENMPAYAVTDAELTHVTQVTMHEWAFCCTDHAGINYFSLKPWYDLTPHLQQKLHVVSWNNNHIPSQLGANASNWQSKLQYRVDQLTNVYSPDKWGTGWYSIEVMNEGFWYSAPNYLAGNMWLTLDGPTYWYTMFDRFVADGTSANVLLNVNDFSNGNASANWGNGPPSGQSFFTANDWIKFSHSIWAI